MESNANLTRIFAKSAARTLAPLSAQLAEQSDRIERIEIYPVNLERVFMRLTGRALRD